MWIRCKLIARLTACTILYEFAMLAHFRMNYICPKIDIYIYFLVNALSGWIFWKNLVEMIYIFSRLFLPNFITKFNRKVNQKAQSIKSGAHNWYAPDLHPIYIWLGYKERLPHLKIMSIWMGKWMNVLWNFVKMVYMICRSPLSNFIKQFNLEVCDMIIKNFNGHECTYISIFQNPHF